MKLKLLTAIVVLSFAACSDDDQSTAAPKKLQEVTNTSYDEEGDVYVIHKLFFEDGQLSVARHYTNAGMETGRTEYIYNDDSILIEANIYSNSNPVPSYTSNYIYDTQGRLADINQTAFQFEETVTVEDHVVYNNDNTISYWRESENGENLIYTYYVNDNGKIFKVMNDDGETMEVIYEGNDIASLTDPEGTTMYSFDNVTEVKGDYRKVISNQYSNDVNAVLAAGLPSFIGGIDRYQIASDGPTMDTETVYEFDDDGYPIKRTVYQNGSAQPHTVSEIVYE